MASWKSQREGKAEEAIKLNKVVIGEAKKIGDTVLEKKAIFGLTYDKNIKFKNKIKSYKDLEISLKADAGNFYDSLRGKIEGARELLNFAKLKKEDFKKQLLIEAKDASLTALKDAINVGYIRAEELASDLLSEIYKELRDERKQKSYEKRANELRNKFSFPGAIDNK